ncbi:MAG: hypothetical protein ABSA77_07355 [Thermoguttaceae bacterium]
MNSRGYCTLSPLARPLASGIYRPAALDAIAAEGYNTISGARPLKRLIQQNIQNSLAVEVLKKDFAEGSRVRINCVGGEFTFERIE